MAKKKMPVNVLEESAAAGGEPALDSIVAGGDTGCGAERPMSDATRAKVEARRLGRARDDVRTWTLGSLLIGLSPCWSVAYLILAVVLFSLARKLGRRYGGDAAWELGWPLLAAVAGAGVALHLGAYLACWLPLLGRYSEALWIALASAGAVCVTGRVFIKHYEAGCTLLGFDVARMHEYFRGRYGAGE